MKNINEYVNSMDKSFAFGISNNQIDSNQRYTIERIELIDIVYRGISDEETDSNEDMYSFSHADESIIFKRNSSLYSLNDKFAGAVKNRAWHHENEVRLRVVLEVNEESSYPEKIALPYDSKIS